MSDLQDVKPSYEVYTIDGKEVKIDYDFNAIAELETHFCADHSVIIDLVTANGIAKINDIKAFCVAGMIRFIKKEDAEALFEKADNFRSIFDTCISAFYKRVLKPSIYEHLMQGAEETEKKIQEALKPKKK